MTVKWKIFQVHNQTKRQIELLKAALEHLLEYFGEKYDCWFRPPLILAQISRSPSTATKIKKKMDNSPVWNIRGFLDVKLQKEFSEYCESSDNIRKYANLWNWYQMTFGPLEPHNTGIVLFLMTT